jgi:hypothetical protein
MSSIFLFSRLSYCMFNIYQIAHKSDDVAVCWRSEGGKLHSRRIIKIKLSYLGGLSEASRACWWSGERKGAFGYQEWRKILRRYSV